MIAAAALGAGITRPELFKEFAVEVTVVTRVWAFNTIDAQERAAWDLHRIDDREPLHVGPARATGRMDD